MLNIIGSDAFKEKGLKGGGTKDLRVALLMKSDELDCVPRLRNKEAVGMVMRASTMVLGN